MNSQFTRTLPTCCVLQGYQRREQGIRPPAPPQPLKDASASPVLVAVTVPNCRLAAGEELRLVGDSQELGGWELAAAPTLSRSPDGSTWQLVVALAPGQYECKLVIARSKRGSVVCWEGGPNRQLRVPHLDGLEAPRGVPLWQGVCRFGDTSKTQLKASPQVDPKQLKDAATAAVQRRAELTEKRDTLAARLDHLTHEVESSELRVASKRGELQQMVADELAQLKQRGLVSRQVARLEGGTPAAQTAAPPASGTSAAASAKPQPEAERAPPAAASQPAKEAAHGSGGSVPAARAGGNKFRSQGQPGKGSEPSAFQLAKQQLMELLPAEAEAALETHQKHEKLEAAAAAGAKPTPGPPTASAEPKPAPAPAPQPSAAAKLAAPAVAPVPPASALVALALNPQALKKPAAAQAAAAKAAATEAAAQASALKSAANPIKTGTSATTASSTASPTASAPAGVPQKPVKQEQTVQKQAEAAKAPAVQKQAEAAKAPAVQKKAEAPKAPVVQKKARVDITHVLNKPTMPVVAAVAVGQQMFQAYRALWGLALAAALPVPAAQRRIDTVAGVTLALVASIPFWG
ncbi:hypothetical protein ABPG77_005704 [Micractinium sp. CCAP 211/92]